MNGIPPFAENVHAFFYGIPRFSFRKIPISENCVFFSYIRTLKRASGISVSSPMTSGILLMECHALFSWQSGAGICCHI